MWAVSKQKEFESDCSYSDKTVRGVGTYNDCWYGTPSNRKDKLHPIVSQFNAKQCEVDMLLNVDDGTLHLCVVGYDDE